MTDLVSYKDALEELEYQINGLCKEMDYREIELTGCKGSRYELSRRSDKDEELLCRDIIYNYLKLKLEEVRRNKVFLEIYGTSIDEAETRYQEWQGNAITKKEDEE